MDRTLGHRVLQGLQQGHINHGSTEGILQRHVGIILDSKVLFLAVGTSKLLETGSPQASWHLVATVEEL